MSNVELRKDFGPTNTSKGLVDEWQWIPILTGDGVELPEVDAESKATGRLLHKQNRGGVRSLTCFDKAFVEIVEEVLFSCLEFLRTLTI